MTRPHETSPEQIALGHELKTRRADLDLTLAEAGDESGGLSATALQNYERGEIYNPGIRTLLNICRGYKVNPLTIMRKYFGLELPDDIERASINQEALEIGNAVLSLPEQRKLDTLEWIRWQQQRSSLDVNRVNETVGLAPETACAIQEVTEPK